MATTSTTVQELYTDIVADLQVYFSDAVLLPNSQFVMNSFNISGSAGNTVRVPITNTYTDAGSVSAGASIRYPPEAATSPMEATRGLV